MSSLKQVAKKHDQLVVDRRFTKWDGVLVQQRMVILPTSQLLGICDSVASIDRNLEIATR